MQPAAAAIPGAQQEHPLHRPLRFSHPLQELGSLCGEFTAIPCGKGLLDDESGTKDLVKPTSWKLGVEGGKGAAGFAAFYSFCLRMSSRPTESSL